MKKSVLWLDPDSAHIRPLAETLVESGQYAVRIVRSMGEADTYLAKNQYDLLILAIIIPTKNEAEEKRYPPEQTNRCLDAGLVFYQKNKELLAKAGTTVIVMTTRIDKDIADEFIKEGLPDECYLLKQKNCDCRVFTDTITGIMQQHETI